MRRIFFFLFTASVFFVRSQPDQQALEQALRSLGNVSFKKVSQDNDFLIYDLLIQQPLDHQHPAKGNFFQRVQLIHKGFSNPTVMETQGYWLFEGRNELEQSLHANYLNIEYRFYGKSIPDSMHWELLTLEQASADLHAINQLFRKIYKGKWISTGVSKGGQTCLFYKYFFPGDVDAAVPYVAPVNNSVEDKRIYTFLDTVGDAMCRKKIFCLQEYLLRHEEEALEKLSADKKIMRMEFSYLGSLGKAYEYAVLEYAFAFWQEGIACETVPDTASFSSCLNNLLAVCPLSFWSDKGIQQFSAHYYQSATQTGYYGYNIAPFKKYIRHFAENPSAIFPPKSVKINYTDCSLPVKLQQWLSENGNNILYIYGGLDTWSACRVTVSEKVNSKSFLLPGESHSTANIANMPAQQQREFAALIKKWTKIDLDLNALKAGK